MELLGGATGTYSDGVFFTEDAAVESRISEQVVRVEVSRQNSNLAEVKKRLAREVLRQGGNALVGFEYGQRSHSALAQLFSFKWDTESWHGSGYVARL